LKTAYLIAAALVAGLSTAACGGGGGGGGSQGGSSTGTSGIVYGANEIVFGVPAAGGATFSVEEIKPGAAVSTLATGVPTSILLFTQIPRVTNSFVIAADLSGKGVFGIYTSTGLSTSAVSTVVSPKYSYVSSLSISTDGAKLVYSATLAADPTQTSYLYSLVLANGLPVQLDYSDGSALSPADNDTIAYVANRGGSAEFDQVFTRSLSAGVSGKATQITTDQANHLLPAINRQGTEIAYWDALSPSVLMLQQIGSSAAPVTLSNPNKVVPQGVCFNLDGSQVAIAADASGTGEILTQSTSAGSTPNVLLMNSTELVGNYGVYWTDSSGRALMSSIMPSIAKRKLGLSSVLGFSR
jgi:hypothetical protein